MIIYPFPSKYPLHLVFAPKKDAIVLATDGFSANTILKFLEEPEDDIIAFLVTDNRYHVIDTILSRCQILTLKDDFFTVEIDDQILDLLDCVMNPNNFFIKYNSA